MRLNRGKAIILGILFAAGIVHASDVADFSYVTNNGAITITKYTGPGGDITIPAEIDGLPVTAIGASDTHEKRGPDVTVAPGEMSAAWLPKSLRVFHPTEPINEIKLPQTLTTIGDFAFMNCREMTNCELPVGVTSIGDYAFHGCMELKNLHIPDGVTTLGHRAISSCLGLTDLRLGPNLVSAGDAAFVYCESLTNFHLPRALTNLGQGALAECHSLTNISVDTDNTHFAVTNGMLFDASFKKLILCPGGLTQNQSSSGPQHLVFSEFFYDQSGDIFADKSERRSKVLFTAAVPETVTSIEPWAFSSCHSLTSIYLPEQITAIGDSAFSRISLNSIKLPSGIQSIGKNAFWGCRDLGSIEIPASCDFLGENAFSGCKKLTNITVETGNRSFRTLDGILYNKDLTELLLCPRSKSGHIAVPTTVMTIRSRAFYKCDRLTGILNAKEIETIGNSSFYRCYNLKHIELGDNLASIGAQAFLGCSKLEEITLPQGVTHIPPRTFEGCGSLKRVNAEGALTSIGHHAFLNCSSIAHAPLPDTVTTIGKAAFEKCGRLNRVAIPEGVTHIAPETFTGSKRLRHVTIPNSVTSIGKGAFMGCEELRSPELPPGLTTIEPNTFKNCYTLKHVTLPEGVTTIGKSAFEECYRLEFVDIPESVNHIGESAFSSCRLKTLSLPPGITSIEKNTFSGNEFHHINIPANVTNIAENAFAYCDIETRRMEFAGDAPTIATNALPRNRHGYPSADLHYWLGMDGWSNSSAGFETILRDPAHPDFVFSVENGEATIEDYVGAGRHIMIPSHILDHPVTTIECLSRGRTSSVTNIILPETVTKFHTLWLHSTISYVEVNPDNPVYSSENGMLFNKDKTKLISCPPAQTGSPTLPNSVWKLERNAFSHCYSLTTIEIPEGIEVIPSGTFASCTNLTSLTLPNTVQTIGSGAFSGCTGLFTLKLPPGVQRIGANAFSGCSNLREMTIPSGVTSIEGYLFYQCKNLAAISMPEGVVSIGNKAFAGCARLEELKLPQSVTNLVHWPFSNCERLTEITIPDGVTELSTAAFNGCSNLERITFSSSHPTYSTLNGMWLSKDQTRLFCCPFGITGEIEIPASVTNIMPSAFHWKDKLSAITVAPSNPNYASIDGVLYDKERTTLIRCPRKMTGAIHIPSTVTNIPHSALLHTTDLAAIHVAEPNPAFSSFDGTLYDQDKTKLIRCPGGKPGTIRIPASVTNSPAGALSRKYNIAAIVVDPDNPVFSDVDGVLYNKEQTKLMLCPRGKSGTLRIPATVSSIARRALDNCAKLDAIEVSNGCKRYSAHDGVLFNKSLTWLIRCPSGKMGYYALPNTVEGMSIRAFSNCKGLTEIKLGPNVETIRSFTFTHCTGLKRINIPESMKRIEEAAFAGCPKDMEFILEGIPRVTIRDNLFSTEIIRF